MSEIDALVGIYGAIDRAAQTDARARAAVSRLLPQYRDPSLRWFDDFERWLKKERPGVDDPEKPLFPGLPEALEELHEVEPKGRLRPRRLFTIAAATRAFPEMLDPESELRQAAIGALNVGPVLDSGKAAQSLLELLGGEADLPNVDGSGPPLRDWWAGVVSAAVSKELVPGPEGMFPRPCSGQLVTVPGLDGPVAALKTELLTEEIDFEAATRFIAPENWKRCMPKFWCRMTAIKGARPGMHRYHEVVSSDCESKQAAAFRAETELDFTFTFIPEGAPVGDAEAAITNYQLAEGRPAPGDLIVVDEGSLVVARTAPGSRQLLVTSTKRIQFNFPFSSEALAMMMCALGYADVAGNLLSCCARNSGKPKAGTRFPAGAPRSRGAPLRAPRRAGSDAPRAVPTGGTGQMVQDMAGMWARVLREGATVIERTTRATGTGTRTRDRSED
jgi:hypothetical protein